MVGLLLLKNVEKENCIKKGSFKGCKVYLAAVDGIDCAAWPSLCCN